MSDDVILPDEDEDVPRPPHRDVYGELSELREYVRELQNNVVWLRKALEQHNHMTNDAIIDSGIEYDSEKPTGDYIDY